MKKLLMAVAAFGVLLTSCAKDDTAQMDSVVTFTVNTPDVATRAYGEGKEATTLYWAVYDQNGIVEQLTGSKSINLSTTVDLKLIQGRTYDVLFWAANASMANVYKVDFTTKSMEIDYAALEANQESYDAFFKYENLGTVNGAMSRTVELRRPFAQLNIGTADTEDAKKAEFEIQQTAVTVKQVFTKLDLATGIASEEQDVTFALANKAEGTIAANGKNYDHIAMNYLLVNGKKLINVDLTINNGTSSLTRSYTSVPVERNYRTNIVGNIITAPAEFNVVILPGFIKPDYETIGHEGAKVNGVAYETLAEAIANAYDGDVIELAAGEFDLPLSITTKGTRAAARHLGFIGQGDATVINFSSQLGAGSDGGLNCYADGLSLSFQDVKVVAPAYTSYTGGFGRAASVRFKNCTFVGQYRSCARTIFENCVIDPQNSYIYTDAADVDFIGCTFNASEGKAIQVYSDNNSCTSTVNITDCTFNAAKIGYTWDEKPVTAIDINSIGGKFTVNINNSTATGFGTGLYSESTLWNIKGGEQHITVRIDGDEIVGPLSKGYTKDEGSNTYHVYNAKGLKAINDMFINKTIGTYVNIILEDNIDYTGKVWQMAESHQDYGLFLSSFDGKGHTISNFQIEGQAMFQRFAGIGEVTIKDVKFDNATVNANGINASILCVQMYQNTVLDNVDITNSSISGNYKVAPYIGSVYDEKETQSTSLTMKNCDVSETTVTCTMYDFSTTGMVAMVFVDNNEVITFDNCSVKDVQLYAKPNGYSFHASIYTTDADTDDIINETAGVTVENVTFTAIE